MVMKHNCRDCEHYDLKHAQIYDEHICTLADEVIVLKRGQQSPNWCPLKKSVTDGELRLSDYITVRLSEIFGSPCNFIDDEMCEYCKDNCPPKDVEDHDSKLEDIECWKRVLNKWSMERKE